MLLTFFVTSSLLFTIASFQYINFIEKDDCNGNEKIMKKMQSILTQQRRLQQEVDKVRQDSKEFRDLLTKKEACDCLSIDCIFPFDCYDIYNCGQKKTGIYKIYPITTLGSTQVLCDMDSNGGGWTVIQHRNRESPHVNFNTTWDKYKQGFGDVLGNYWLGNNVIHTLTTRYYNSLYIKMETTKNESFEVQYSSFSISNETDGYRLSLGTMSGNIVDAFRSHPLVNFTFFTYDHDTKDRCASRCKSGWWYNSCTWSNLNAPFFEDHVSPVWDRSISDGKDLFLSEMLIKRT